MSSKVPDALLKRAEAGDVDDDEFIACVRDSLPYAWAVVSEVAGEMQGSRVEFADHAVLPPSEVERGQLLRALTSDAIRGRLERHFGVALALQDASLRWASARSRKA